MTTVPDVRAATERADVTEELRQARELLDSAGAEYSDAFGAIFGEDEIQRHLGEISIMRGAAMQMNLTWLRTIADLPSRDRVQQASDAILGAGAKSTVAWLKQVFAKTQDLSEVAELTRLYQSTSDVGYELLRSLTSVLPFMVHFENECRRTLDQSNVKSAEVIADATATRQTLETIVTNIERDVAGQRSQVQVFGMYSQVSATEEVRGFTRALTVLTMLLVVLAVGALILSSIGK